MVFKGAHISREETLSKTIAKIIDNGGNALQIFASNPRSAKISELNPKFFDIDQIKNVIKKKKFSLIIHNPYVINLASPFMINKRVMDIKDCYWIQLIIHELKVADTIGALGCVVHCGKYTSNSPESGLENMKKALDYVIDEIKELKLKSKIILETSSGQGTELLFNYQDFLNFYNSFNDDQKNYIKICIDTCHVWASGFELSEVYTMTKNSGNLKDVMVIHINNSKNPKNSHLDRHDIITQGHMNIADIIKFLKVIRKNNRNLIFILETPDEGNIKEEFKLIK
jgi:deoxyribonuclease-4